MNCDCSLVIPVYRNEESLVALLDALEIQSADLGRRLEVIFVVDGSPDRSAELLAMRLPHAGFPAELICLSRNFGSFAAIRHGLAVAKGQFVAVMAADLQEPPELLAAFFRCLESEPADVVIGQRIGRSDPLLARLSANVFWGVFRWLINRDIPRGGIDVFACNRAARDALLSMREANTSLVGQLMWIGFRRRLVSYRRRPRQGGGRSAWTFRKKLRYMLDSLYSFTDVPILAMMWLGAAGMLLSLGVGFLVLMSWALGGITVPGYAPIMLLVSFSLSLNLLCFGIVGNYLWRAFENTKARPLTIPMTHQSFRKPSVP